jgi:segregation and condensation protein B
MDKLELHIESVIFSSEQPISVKEIKDCLEQSMDTKLKKGLIDTALENLIKKYQDESFAFEIVEISNGYQFLTKGAYHHTIGTLLKQKAKKRLSKAALETLAIIAYKQPTTKSQAEAIRGVSCDYSIQKLLEKELVTILGRSDGPGKPLLYATSDKFMNYFGLKSIKDLPKLKDFNVEDNTIGEAAAGEEVIEQRAVEEIVITENSNTGANPQLEENEVSIEPTVNEKEEEEKDEQ